MNNIVTYLSICILVLFVGCEKRMSLPMTAWDISHEANVLSVSNGLVSLSRSFETLSNDEQLECLSIVENCITNICLNESSYLIRNESMKSYHGLIEWCCKILESKILDKEALWNLKLRLLARNGYELTRSCTVPCNGIGYTGNAGIILSQRDYQESLRRMLFDSIRKGFEDNRHFASFFDGLSDEKRIEWIKKLQMVAGREVRICTNKHPDVILPSYSECFTNKNDKVNDDVKSVHVELFDGGQKITIRRISDKTR